MKRFLLILMCLLCLNHSAFPGIIASKIYVEPDPKPNMTEKYVPLKLYKTLGPEIAPDVFIYLPISLTLDKDGNLFVFDRAQHRIVQMNKDLQFVRFIGSAGEGEGQFYKSPKAAVFLNFGLDNKLYCADSVAQKIIVFDNKGRYIKEIFFPKGQFGKPLVDAGGQVYFFSGNSREIVAHNQNGEMTLKIPVNARHAFSMMFRKQKIYKNNFNLFFMYTIMEPDNMLLYFANSSLMYSVRRNEIFKEYRILPQDLLSEYKKKIDKLEGKSLQIPLFARLIPDSDTNESYYLPHIKNQTTNRSLIYQMNLGGELERTYYVEYDQAAGGIWILAKKNNFFYARRTRDEVIEIYREEE